MSSRLFSVPDRSSSLEGTHQQIWQQSEITGSDAVLVSAQVGAPADTDDVHRRSLLVIALVRISELCAGHRAATQFGHHGATRHGRPTCRPADTQARDVPLVFLDAPNRLCPHYVLFEIYSSGLMSTSRNARDHPGPGHAGINFFTNR